MSDWTGGCLCGQLRWEADAGPDYMGNCYCADCRKASGSGFIPFMGYAADRPAWAALPEGVKVFETMPPR
jgi:hypothetical protein